MTKETLFLPISSGNSLLVKSPRLHRMIRLIKDLFTDKRFYEERLLYQILQEIGRMDHLVELRSISPIVVLAYPQIYSPWRVDPEDNSTDERVIYQIVLSDEIIQLFKELAKKEFLPSYPPPEAIRTYDPSTIQGQLANFIVNSSYSSIY